MVSGKATIQARTIILEVARVLSAHKWRFAINVNFNGSTDSFFFQVMNNAIKNKGFVLLLLFCPRRNQASFGYWNLRSLEVNLSSQLLILSIQCLLMLSSKRQLCIHPKVKTSFFWETTENLINKEIYELQQFRETWYKLEEIKWKKSWNI